MYRITNIDEAFKEIYTSLQSVPGFAYSEPAIRASLERGLMDGDTIDYPAGGSVVYKDGALTLIRDGKLFKTIEATEDALRKVLILKASRDGSLFTRMGTLR